MACKDRYSEKPGEVITRMGKWYPEQGGEFWLVTGDGCVDRQTNNGGYANGCILLGNCFKTRQAAQQAKKKIRALLETLE